MRRTLTATALLLAIAILTSRVAAAEPVKVKKTEPIQASEPAKPLWEQPVDLKLDSQPALLANQTAGAGRSDYSDNWRFRTYTTFWMARVDGTVGKDDFQADIDISFDEILDKSTVGLSLNFEVGKGPWSLIFFGLWVHFEDDPETRLGFDADFDGNFILIDVAGAYHFMDFPLGGGQTIYLEALVGARGTYLNHNIEINEGPLAGARRERDTEFVDPYVGLRARWYINDDWNITGMGTVGGFGVGSDLTASGEFMAEWRFSNRWSAVLGYRAIYTDYDDIFEWQVTMHGPFVGISTRW